MSNIFCDNIFSPNNLCPDIFNLNIFCPVFLSTKFYPVYLVQYILSQFILSCYPYAICCRCSWHTVTQHQRLSVVVVLHPYVLPVHIDSVLTGNERSLDRECMTDSVGRYYTGTMNRTLSGRACQAWSSQSPHVHPYDDVSYFADNVNSLDQVANYCRNPSMGIDSVIDKRPWCYTMDASEDDDDSEFCDINICKGIL